MTLFEDRTDVFILRMWLESREVASAGPEWRGVIIHVESGQRQYINAASEILGFLKPYMDTLADRVTIQTNIE